MAALAALRTLLGPSGFLETEADMAPYLTDWRGRYTGRARAVALPRSTQEVAQIVRQCAASGIAIVPQGGNTGLVGGATPDESGNAIVLSTRRLNRIRSVDTDNDSCVAEAGCLLQEVQQAAQEKGRLFPLSLAAEGSCTIGGNLATNAGGVQVLRYGNARELTLGLEVVLADGSIWDGLRALRKDNTGYDCKQLFIGSEGTLGIITAACLKLFPAPRSQVVCLLALPSIGAALALLQRARAVAGASLTAFELISAPCIALLQSTGFTSAPPFAAHPPWLALLECSGHEKPEAARERCEALCAAAIAAGEASDAILSQSLADCARLWELRERIPEAQTKAGGNVKHDISLPLQAWEEFIGSTSAALAQLCPELQVFAFGHLGDGNLHFNVGQAPGASPRLALEREAAINAVVYPAVQRLLGSVSAEHGLGQLRRSLARSMRGVTESKIQGAIKAALDPHKLFNPGKVL